MKTALIVLLAALPLTGMADESAMVRAEEPFRPKVVPTNEVVVALSIQPRNNLPLVEAVIDGVKATLLFDTGASHTTFDRAFVEKRLPAKKLEPIQLVGQTNVRNVPACFPVGVLKLGGAEFGDFLAMTVPLGQLEASVGRRVDGIIGMNLIRPVPVRLSLGSSRVTFNPADRDLSPRPLIATGLLPRVGSPSILVDSGSSFTFLQKGLWPASTNRVAFAATGVNGTDALRPVVGERGRLDRFGVPVEVTPFLVDEPRNLLGADTLLRYDLIIVWPRLRFL